MHHMLTVADAPDSWRKSDELVLDSPLQ